MVHTSVHQPAKKVVLSYGIDIHANAAEARGGNLRRSFEILKISALGLLAFWAGFVLQYLRIFGRKWRIYGFIIFFEI